MLRHCYSEEDMADWENHVLGISPGLSGPKGVITDTGVRYEPKGSLALYTAGGYEAIGLVCAKCSGLATNALPGLSVGTVENHY